jgi:hypothetical protein
MTPKEVLIAAKALIDTPEKWCQYHSRLGKRMCASTALNSVDIPTGAYLASQIRQEARVAVLQLCGNVDIEVANDAPETGHADVMAWFDRAILAAGGD